MRLIYRECPYTGDTLPALVEGCRPLERAVRIRDFVEELPLNLLAAMLYVTLPSVIVGIWVPFAKYLAFGSLGVLLPAALLQQRVISWARAHEDAVYKAAVAALTAETK